MADIKEFPGVKPDANGRFGREKFIHDEVVRLAEETLRLAKSGEIKAIAFGVVYADNTTGNSFSANDCTSALIGALEFAKMRLMQGSD